MFTFGVFTDNGHRVIIGNVEEQIDAERLARELFESDESKNNGPLNGCSWYLEKREAGTNYYKAITKYDFPRQEEDR